MKFKKRTLAFLLIGTIFLSVCSWWQNNAMQVSEYEYRNPIVPESFHGYTIVQISDLHNKDFHGRLIDKVKSIKPDLILITGDLIDRRNTKIEIAVTTAEQLREIAPTYYVSGNHEQLSRQYNRLKEELVKLEVPILDNDFRRITRGGETISLLGLADPAVNQREDNYLWGDNSHYAKTQLQALLERHGQDSGFLILLSHRPELFQIYKELGMDLVFAGHAHGGQIRLPFIGGLVAPNQGLFPKYTAGVYQEDDTFMVVSRGLGNSIIPQRLFNRPELVVVTLATP